ncbi:MAG: acetolactate synthase 3 large subunit [Sphingomonadaceae bacterium]|uniref:acetolactate synthase 3 large subunit n=1 Tax=Thermaurantiacus sp. TaxID=2820283 RepID=UPI00298F31A8|nr:acetolactate synthase 3 large subunit [Thermaurantiacus sp.]MCS6987046.1 acetolactate synthase 3 large subunit [Sphingomonadaceae bacterium]MDW8415616.1 acetolactate synthase 3 large subunit [Thermaurantiacus sp.]
MPAREMTGAEILVEALVDLGVEVIFGYPGGAVLPIYDVLHRQRRIRHILVRHEQGAVHAAEGYARASGRPGVVLVTSGPGATNAVTGITDALMDSVPIVVITGQVPTHLIGTDAFQECDTVGITRHCSKHNYLVKDVGRLGPVVHEAFHIATTGRPGPVVIDIPKDVQVARARYERPGPVVHRTYRPRIKGDPALVETAVELLASAERPILYTGGGIINSGPLAVRKLRELAQLCGAPVTSTLMGLGAFPASSPQWLGMLGMHGTYEANMAMNRCDVMLALGARFDDRVTGRIDAFSPGSRKIHVDIDPSSFHKTVRVDLAIEGDVGHVLDDMVRIWRARALKPAIAADWWTEIAAWRARDCLAYVQEGPAIEPQHAIRRLWAAVRHRDPIITTEVGQHQMWAAQHFPFEEPNRWLTSGGLGTMGYGLPAAIGAQVAFPDRLVIDIAGEASILMNIQEMGTAAQYRLPVKVFVLNNEYMGMVRQWQDLTYEGRHAESYSASLPDFVKLAEAWGWRGIRIATADELDEGIARMLSHDGPAFVDCRVKKYANCLPMIPSGAAHTEMILKESEIRGELDAEAEALV